jgi:glycosyltransferase involved in cell wall biosynthesis
MQIISVVPGPALNGGVGTYIEFFIQNLPEYSHCIISDGSVKFDVDACWIDISGFSRMPSIFSLAVVIRTVMKDFKKGDIVVVHSTAGLLIGIFLTFFGVNAIPIIHGRASKYSGILVRLIEKFAVRYCHKTVFMNRHDMIGLQPKSFKIIHNCVMKNIPSKQEIAREVEGNLLSVVIVARHSPQKNLSIIPEVAKLNVSIPFYIYGDGPDFCKNKDLYSDISNLYFQKEEAVENIYTDGNIFLLPTFSEGFPLAVMEAASRKLPILLSDIPELREIFTDKVQYFKNDDIEGLSTLIHNLANNRHTFESWSEKSLKITEIYTQDSFTQSWRNIIEERF